MIGKTLQELRIGERAEFTKTISESDVYLRQIDGDLIAHINENRKRTFQDPLPIFLEAHFRCSREQTAGPGTLSQPALRFLAFAVAPIPH
jgi:hypothetical protein